MKGAGIAVEGIWLGAGTEKEWGDSKNSENADMAEESLGVHQNQRQNTVYYSHERHHLIHIVSIACVEIAVPKHNHSNHESIWIISHSVVILQAASSQSAAASFHDMPSSKALYNSVSRTLQFLTQKLEKMTETKIKRSRKRMRKKGDKQNDKHFDEHKYIYKEKQKVNQYSNERNMVKMIVDSKVLQNA